MTAMSRIRPLRAGLALVAAMSVFALALALAGTAPAATAQSSTCFGKVPTISDTGPVIEGTDGDDVIRAFGQDVQLLVNGRGGNDRICVSNGSAATISGGDGNDLMIGAVVIRGGPGNDVIYGMSGEEELDGQGGNDTIFGRFGNDLLVGGNGDDDLFGQAGNDVLRANDGDDLLFDEEGENQLFCGAGFDGATNFLQAPDRDCEFSAP